MARSFSSSFLAQAASKSARPYLVLEVDWGGTTGTRYYLDRPANSFATNDGRRIPNAGVDSSVVVVRWPTISLSLKEGQIGATDQTSVVLDDTAGAITAILSSEEKQRTLVSVWRMFDDPTCIWDADKALIFLGCLRPFDWSAEDNRITLQLGDLGPLLAKSVSFPATSAIFPNIPNEYQDRSLPLCWGYAQRVEAVLVSKPWVTNITQNTDGSAPCQVSIADHPADIGVDGSGHTIYQGYLGLDAVQVTFQQSSDPNNTASTATISKLYDPTLASAVLLGTVDGAGRTRFILQDQSIRPTALSDVLADYVGAGSEVVIQSAKLGTVTTTLSTIITDAPWPGWYQVSFNDPAGTLAANLQIDDTLKFLKNGSAMRAWPNGTRLCALDGNYVFVANALPSKNVSKVEGFGTLTDQAGNNRAAFIPLGSYRQTFVAGSANQTVTGTAFSVNLDDNTWNNPIGSKLGHNVTSITFPGSPRDVNNNLADDRIWVTLEGVEDQGDSRGNLITNPALIVLEYLENPYLMNVAPASVNMASFTAAASALAQYACGFAQVDSADGLALLQHITQLCHSVLLFDQGQANLMVLSDAPGTIRATFDCAAHDNLLQGSLSRAEAAVDDIVNDLTLKWRARWDDISGNQLLDSKNVKLTSIAAFGRISRELNPVDIYWRRADVAAERDWWLNHWSSIWRTVSFTAFLDACVLQPGDWVNVTWVDGAGRNVFGGAQPAQVTKVTDQGGNGLVTIDARYVQFAYS
jgi:hypothetical protein